jgi:hypothetical protein
MEPEKIDFVQLSVRQRMSPFPNYFSMECISKEMKDALGTAYKYIMLIFKENLMYVFFDKSDFERVGSYALKKVLENPDFFHKMVKIVDENGKDFVNWAKSISKKDISKYTNEQIADFHKQYERKYKSIYSRYFTILGVEFKLAEYLKSYLIKNVSDPQLMQDYFSVLITEPRAQVTGREYYAALKLAKKIVENEKWIKHFSMENAESAVRKDPELNKLFEEHEKDYFWITRDYEDPVLTYSDFVKRMIKILKEKPLEKLEEKRKSLESVDKNIIEIEKKADVDEKHSKIFNAMREGIHLKELRKAYVSQSLYYYDAILKEIAKRSHVSLRAIRHIKTEEVESVFTDEKLHEELYNRVKLSVFFTEYMPGKRRVKRI